MEGVLSRVVLTDADGNVDTSQAPAIPEQFLKDLLQVDKELFVLWAPLRGRYFIHQCVEHCGQGAAINNGHTQLCRSVYVLICADRDGDMVPLNERVIQSVLKRRAYSEQFGGATERGLENFRRHTKNVQAELEAKREADLKDTLEHAKKDNRGTWNRLWTLAERHLFTSPNK